MNPWELIQLAEELSTEAATHFEDAKKLNDGDRIAALATAKTLESLTFALNRLAEKMQKP